MWYVGKYIDIIHFKTNVILHYCTQVRLGVFDQADGSAYIEQGNTRVLAAVYGPHEVGHE